MIYIFSNIKLSMQYMGPTKKQVPVSGYYFFFLSGACVSTDPATDLTAFEDFGLRRSFAAFEATFFEVFSFLPIIKIPFISDARASFIDNY